MQITFQNQKKRKHVDLVLIGHICVHMRENLVMTSSARTDFQGGTKSDPESKDKREFKTIKVAFVFAKFNRFT